MRRFAVVAGALGWATLAMQLYLTSRTTLANGKDLADDLVIYFSFFTILTNILVALAFSLPLMPIA